MKPKAMSSSSLEEVGATTTFGGTRLTIFSFAASLNRSSLFKQANMLSAKKIQTGTLHFTENNPNP